MDKKRIPRLCRGKQRSTEGISAVREVNRKGKTQERTAKDGESDGDSGKERCAAGSLAPAYLMHQPEADLRGDADKIERPKPKGEPLQKDRGNKPPKENRL